MKLKLLAVSLVLMLIVCLAWGCASNQNPQETAPDTAPDTTEESLVESVAAESESALETEPETEPEPETDNVTLRLGVMSDTHIGANVGNNMNKALEALKSVSGDRIDLMLFSGDLTDTTASTLSTEQLSGFRSKYAREMAGVPFVFCLGSTHDLPAMSGTTRPATLETVRELYKTSLGNFDYDLSADTYVTSGIRHAVMNGYHVFAIDYLPTDEALELMVDEMEVLTAEDADKPIFVILHNPAETYITQLFADFPQVITFSGHFHNSSAREDSIKQDGGYTQIHIGGTAYYRVDGYNRFNGSNPFLDLGDIYKFAQSLYVEVADDNTVTVYRVDGYTGKTFGEPWVISPDTRDVYTDARKETAKPCTFPESAELTVVEGTGGTVTVTFDGATMGDAGPALYYNVVIMEQNDQGQYVAVQTADIGSQQVFYPNDEGIPAGHYSHTFTGVNLSDYAVVVRAVDCWQKSVSALVHTTGGFLYEQGNVALGKRVTVNAGASHEVNAAAGGDSYGVAMLTDGYYGWWANQTNLHPSGTKQKGWLKPDGSSTGSETFIITENNPLDIVIDLGALYEIDSVIIRPITNFQNVFPTYFEIQISESESGDDWVTVHEARDVYCNGRLSSSADLSVYEAMDESDKKYEAALAEAKNARRVRIHITTPSASLPGNGDCYMGFGEIEVWGELAE